MQKYNLCNARQASQKNRKSEKVRKGEGSFGFEGAKSESKTQHARDKILTAMARILFTASGDNKNQLGVKKKGKGMKVRAKEKIRHTKNGACWTYTVTKGYRRKESYGSWWVGERVED